MDKLINEYNEIAVVHTDAPGSPWSSGYPHQTATRLCMDKTIARAVQRCNLNAAIIAATRVAPDFQVLPDTSLTITWLPANTEFLIEERDGCETVITKDELKFFTT